MSFPIPAGRREKQARGEKTREGGKTKVAAGGHLRELELAHQPHPHEDRRAGISAVEYMVKCQHASDQKHQYGPDQVADLLSSQAASPRGQAP